VAQLKLSNADDGRTPDSNPMAWFDSRQPNSKRPPYPAALVVSDTLEARSRFEPVTDAFVRILVAPKTPYVPLLTDVNHDRDAAFLGGSRLFTWKRSPSFSLAKNAAGGHPMFTLSDGVVATEAFESKTMWFEKEKRSEYDSTKVIKEKTMNGVSNVEVELAPARTLDSWSAVLFVPEFSIDSDTAAEDVERMWQRGLTADRTFANVHAWWDRKYRPNVARRAAARDIIAELRKRGASPAELDAAIAEQYRLV
jgi:hypothetical protein